MTYGKVSILCAGVLLAAGAGVVSGKDWPEWCGQPSRNMAIESDQRLPDWADCGVENDRGEVDLQSTKNVKWVAKLGRRTTGSPIVSGGRVFIGTNWEDGREACLLCLDEQTGRRLGTFICPKPPRDKLENWAIPSTPTVQGDRLYFVSPHQEVMCIDLAWWHQEQTKHRLQQPLCCQRRSVCRDRQTPLGPMRQGRSGS